MARLSCVGLALLRLPGRALRRRALSSAPIGSSLANAPNSFGCETKPTFTSQSGDGSTACCPPARRTAPGSPPAWSAPRRPTRRRTRRRPGHERHGPDGRRPAGGAVPRSSGCTPTRVRQPPVLLLRHGDAPDPDPPGNLTPRREPAGRAPHQPRQQPAHPGLHGGERRLRHGRAADLQQRPAQPNTSADYTSGNITAGFLYPRLGGAAGRRRRRPARGGRYRASRCCSATRGAPPARPAATGSGGPPAVTSAASTRTVFRAAIDNTNTFNPIAPGRRGAPRCRSRCPRRRT